MDQELIAYLDRRFADLDDRFANQDRRFDHQDRSIEDLKESHRHTQVVVEGLRSDVQAVAEGVASVDQKLERHLEAIGRRIDGDQAVVQASFKTLRRRVTRLETAEARPPGG